MGGWRAHGATSGKVLSKRQTIFGYKLHLPITLGGVVSDFELAPADVVDLDAGVELLAGHTGLSVLADRGCITADEAAVLWRNNLSASRHCRV